jgi:hypothetical protein
MQGTLKCPKCKVWLGDLTQMGESRAICPRCLKDLQVWVFPAIYRPLSAQVKAAESVMEGEATCFYHTQKKAVVACESCGRYVCSLCDVDFNGQHLCPTCLETGARKKNITSLERERPLHGRQAFILSLIPVFLTGPVAVFMAIRYWNAPGSLVKPRRWYTRVALVFGLIQTILLVMIIISIINSP